MAGGGRGRRAAGVTLAAVVLVLAAAYVGVALWGGDDLPRDASVEGIDVGGLSRALAGVELEALPTAQRVTVTLPSGDEAPLDPAEAGLSLDTDATLEEAAGGAGFAPTRVWALLTGGGDVEATVDVDRERLDATLDGLEEDLDDPVREGALAFSGAEVEPVYGQPGTGVRRDAAATQLARQLVSGETLPLPTSAQEPTVTEEAVDRALAEIGEPAVSGPVTLVMAGREIRVRPRLFSQALTTTPADGELRLVVDGDALATALEPRLEEIGSTPVDATFEVQDNDRVRVVPSQAGLGLDPQELEDGWADAALAQGDQRRLELRGQEAQPDLTTEDAEALGIRRRVSTFTTNFPYAEYRNVNIGRAAELVDGTVLRPGETFSMNDVVGERTRENGFTEGFVIADGIFRTDLGGGVSQMATTLFNAAFFAGLEDVEHKPHSVYIDRYPEGREATVSFGSIDLRFRNDTDHGVLIKADVDPSTPGSQGAATVSMYSTKTWRIESRTSDRYSFTSPSTRYLTDDDCEAASGTSGFSVDVFRDFMPPGSDDVVRTEEFNTVYIPGDRVVCEPAPGSDPAPGGGGTTGGGGGDND